MSCPYYYWNGHYACRKAGKDVNEDVYYKYCRNYDYDDCPIYKGNDSSGSCFLTSACVEAKGLADDCHELTVLRAFRDGWLRSQPGGDEAVAEYYRVAPPIVENIKSRNDAITVFETIYDELVLPCVAFIESGKNEAAYDHYKKMTQVLAVEYAT